MTYFDKIFTAVLAAIILLFTAANLTLAFSDKNTGRPYRVEINRLANEIETSGPENISLDSCLYVTSVTRYNGSDPDGFFEGTDRDYSIRIIGGTAYRFDFTLPEKTGYPAALFTVNLILAVMSLLLVGILLFIRLKIIKPFDKLQNIPYELSRGHLTMPVEENRYRFFGKFVWGINMLRENIEQQRRREQLLLREKKTLILSLSHDIKTPLSAIRLYAGALSKGLYPSREKQLEIAENIDMKAKEIGAYVSRIVQSSNEDFLDYDVRDEEFYLSSLVDSITEYYREKLALLKIGFSVAPFSDCLLKGDLDCSIEVLQNIIENAAKYGDGGKIELLFSREEDCQLITVKNGGCTLPETELPHIFESFIRGTNAGHTEGSGLGLYICHALMHKMNGDIFAEIQDKNMLVTAVFTTAGQT